MSLKSPHFFFFLPCSQAVLVWLRTIFYSADTWVLQQGVQKWLAGTGQPASADQPRPNCSRSWGTQSRWCRLPTPLPLGECLQWLDLATEVPLRSSFLQACWTNSAGKQIEGETLFYSITYFTWHPRYLHHQFIILLIQRKRNLRCHTWKATTQL